MKPLPTFDNPWKITDTKVKMDTHWVRVVLHDVINPAGEASIYGVTEFKSVAVGVIPIDQEGYTWLVGQYRFPTDRYSWEIPEGGGALDTPALESAKRELHEETGIRADHWESLISIHTSNSATNEYGEIFLATGLHFEDSHPDPEEELETRRIHINELYERVIMGEITDSLTVAAVLRVKIMLLEGNLKL